MSQSPIRPTDDAARELAQSLLTDARFGALAVVHPDSGHPHVTRIAVTRGADGAPVSLISELSLHTRALIEHPEASLLIGEPEDRGDPLNHPRLTLAVTARFIDKAAGKARYLDAYPKAKLYFDFGDFRLVSFCISSAELNGGFGKAFSLNADDLGLGASQK